MPAMSPRGARIAGRAGGRATGRATGTDVTPAAVADAAALRSVGLSLAPPVVGLAVLRVPPLYDIYATVGGLAARPPGSSQRPRAWSLVQGRRLALTRLREQCAAMDAVGAVGAALLERTLVARAPASDSPTGGVTLVEFTATGVPVLAPTGSRPARPFLAALPGAQVAALLTAGWVPLDILVAAAIAARDQRFAARDAATIGGYANIEIPGLTDVVTRATSEVRRQIGHLAKMTGANGVLLPDGLELLWAETRHAIQVSAVGTAIVRFDRRSRPASPTTVLPLF